MLFEKANRDREEKENKILASLKKVYKGTMESVRNEEVSREGNEKVFLAILEQLINRISEA